jgi:hypothetical protein
LRLVPDNRAAKRGLYPAAGLIRKQDLRIRFLKSRSLACLVLTVGKGPFNILNKPLPAPAVKLKNKSLFHLNLKAMKKNEKDSDKSKQNNPENTLKGGVNAPNIRDVNKESVQEGNRPTNEGSGVKPRASGRHGSMDVQDGGQDVGSSAGSH